MAGLGEVFERTRADGRAALIPYLTCGDPDPDATVEYACALVEGGADILEIGVPFSDPLADGPVIQRAAERALGRGTTVQDVLRCAARVEDRTGVPVVVMSYVNPLLRFGWQRFCDEAAASGVRGVILTDVPPEEAGPFLPDARRTGIDTVFLVAPTSGPERIARAAEATTGFLYCVSRLGVTGEREDLAGAFRPVLEAVRSTCELPVAIGFGISTPEHARQAGRMADGVIVGSALVSAAERAGTPERAVSTLKSLAWDFRRAVSGAHRAGAGDVSGC